MEPAAYVIGALDALVKAGELSPAYAAGVRDALEKHGGVFVDTPQENYSQELESFIADNPSRVDSDGHLTITGDEAYRLMNSARHWYDNGLSRAKTFAWNKLRKNMRWWPTCHRSAEEFDRELTDDRNKEMLAYIGRNHMRPGQRLDQEIADALQSKFKQDANMRIRDVKKRIPNRVEREAMGYTDNYPDTFDKPIGNSTRAAVKHNMEEVKAVPSVVYKSDMPAGSYWDRSRRQNYRPVR